jgi:thiamine biosynthesis lipoprotein
MTAKPYIYSFPAMGTECNFTLYADEEALADDAADACMAEVWRIEGKYSRYDEESALSGINRAASLGKPVKLDEETAALVGFAFQAYDLSGGLFDITSGLLRRAWDFSKPGLPAEADIERLLPLIGMDKIRLEQEMLHFSVPGVELDFGGLGKEYAVDRCADLCRDFKIPSAMIDLGGDIRVTGQRPDAAPWLISVRHPRAPEKSLGVFNLSNGALATSGDYERYIEVGGKRYCHILNPKTGWPVQGNASVSIFAERCLLAGALSTVAMLKESRALEWLRGLKNVDCCVIDEAMRLHGNRLPVAVS